MPHRIRRRPGVLPKPDRSPKVGRTVLGAPPQFLEEGSISVVSHNSGALRTARPASMPIGQHARHETRFHYNLGPPLAVLVRAGTRHLLTAAVLLLHLLPCSALTLTTLVSFGGTNGAAPSAALIQGADGNFRGTTETVGMPGSRGPLFTITPSGALTTLLEFASSGPYGADPQAALRLAPDGNS